MNSNEIIVRAARLSLERAALADRNISNTRKVRGGSRKGVHTERIVAIDSELRRLNEEWMNLKMDGKPCDMFKQLRFEL